MFVSLPNEDLDFHRHMSLFFVFSDLRLETGGCPVVNIGLIVDHHCLINIREYRRGNQKKDNPENLAT